MMKLHALKNTHRKIKKRRRVGRGIGCKRGRTCGRGEKGDKSRSGYKKRHGKEGGQQPLYMKLPTRGFTVGAFRKAPFAINLSRIDALFEDGETVSRETLHAKGFSKSQLRHGIKVLGTGELKKKVCLEVDFLSKGAIHKLEQAKIDFKLV